MILNLFDFTPFSADTNGDVEADTNADAEANADTNADANADANAEADADANVDTNCPKNKPKLKNRPGKIYKRSDEVRLKISQTLKSRGFTPKGGIKKGQTGKSHPSYKHGLGKSRGYDQEKYFAWIQGVKQQCNFACFITGIKNKEELECHHLDS